MLDVSGCDKTKENATMYTGRMKLMTDKFSAEGRWEEDGQGGGSEQQKP